MKAFRFRLQAVLTLREQAEQTAQQVCAGACVALDQAAARLRSAEAEIAANDQLWRARLAAGLRAEELEQWRLYAGLLYDRRTRMARELAQAREQLEEARRQLLLATRRRETLERLRHRQRRMHDYEAARAEQKLLDELSKRVPLLASSGREEPSLMS
ncbi:MAG: flagellar export protein FliJ [Verrucomicrobiota bacterium]|jgi:flagellar export protein FliJ